MKNWGQKMGKAAWDLLPGLLTFIFFTLILSSGVALGAAKTAKYEAPADKRASEVLPPNLRSGPHFKVQDRVAADGYMLPLHGEFGLRHLPGHRRVWPA